MVEIFTVHERSEKLIKFDKRSGQWFKSFSVPMDKYQRYAQSEVSNITYRMLKRLSSPGNLWRNFYKICYWLCLIKIYPRIPVWFKFEGKMTVTVGEEVRSFVLYCWCNLLNVIYSKYFLTSRAEWMWRYTYIALFPVILLLSTSFNIFLYFRYIFKNSVCSAVNIGLPHKLQEFHVSYYRSI
jgi:hypothetical protein